MNFSKKFPHFYQSKCFSRRLSPENVCQNCPNDKISTNNFYITSRLFEKLLLRKGEKGKYHGDKFSFHCEETLTLTKIESGEK